MWKCGREGSNRQGGAGRAVCARKAINANVEGSLTQHLLPSNILYMFHDTFIEDNNVYLLTKHLYTVHCPLSSVCCRGCGLDGLPSVDCFGLAGLSCPGQAKACPSTSPSAFVTVAFSGRSTQKHMSPHPPVLILPQPVTKLRNFGFSD